MADFRYESCVDEVFGANGVLSQKFEGYQPRPGQIQMAEAVLSAIKSQTHLIAEGPTGCHARGQGILMHDGTIRRVEEIVVGDKLMGPDSRPRTVLQLCRGREEMVDVVPVKGKPWRVNRSHILSLERTDRGNPTKDVCIRDWEEWSKTQKHLWKLFRVGVRSFGGTDERFQISPYHLGVLLGDGNMTVGSVGITKPGDEIEKVAHEIASQFGLRVRSTVNSSGCPTHFIVKVDDVVRRNPLISELRSLGLYGIKRKFIPGKYRCGSVEVRKQVLAGLLDTDGHLASANSFDFISKYRQLSEDVAFVARSLGLAAYITEKVCSAGPGHSDTYWRVHLSGDTECLPMRIKKAAPRQQIKSVLRTGFQIVPTGTVEDYFGFSLDGDQRYLLDDFTVTHNTGKSLSYLVPSIYYATEAKKTIVVATANIALQEQLVNKDLPLLQEILPVEFKYSLFKGKSNYLCEDSLEKFLGDAFAKQTDMFSSGGDGLSGASIEERKIVEWSKVTETGDKSDIGFDPHPSVWPKFSVGSDECKGRRCRHAARCHALRARDNAAASDIIVCNFHVLFANMKFMGAVLPPFDICVMDEAHEAADIARDFLGYRITAAGFNRFAKKLRKEFDGNEDGLSNQIIEHADSFFGDLAKYSRSKSYDIRIEESECVDYIDLAKTLDATRKFLSSKIREVDDKDRKATIEILQRRCAEYMQAVVDAMSLDDANMVHFIEAKADRCTLLGKPVNVSGLLRAAFFETTESVVMASATLSVDDSFDHAIDDIGIIDPDELIVESPFSGEQSLFVIPPKGFPLPNQDTWLEEMSREIANAIRAANGRTLCLFTSFRGLNFAFEHVERELKGSMGYEMPQLLKQGNGLSRSQLVDEFKKDTSSVLFGTRSFWAGVDVPGESLSLVTIDKLPFPSPGDPVLAAMQDILGKKTFFKCFVPRAIIQFKQGAGRLIRSVNDRGVILCLDRRLKEKGYGRQFLNSLPAMKLTSNTGMISEFLGTTPWGLEDIPF